MEFGVQVAGRHYQPRPGSYAVMFNDLQQVAIVETPRGCFLPGGGALPGESPEDTLTREVLEECGCEVEIIGPLGFVTEYVFADGEGYFAKQCSFFQAKLGNQVRELTEPDHRLVWLSIPNATARLIHGSHAWAVTEVRTRSSRGANPSPDESATVDGEYCMTRARAL